MVEKQNRLEKAFQRIDEANSKDPNTEIYQGKTYPKELLYSIRMTDRLGRFAPDAGEALQLTARSQHIQRWEIPRESYPMNRVGYLKWRQDLKIFHAERASHILREVGYDEDTIGEVAFLLQKKQLKRNPETQILEDVICLVFLEYYFEPFLQKHEDEKIIDIIDKTWKKMSEKGKEAALELTFSERGLRLIKAAIST